MFLHRNKKETEYNKTRSVHKKEDNLKFLKKIYRFFYYILVIAFFGIVIYALFFSPFLAIDKIEIKGLENLKIDEVQINVEQSYDGMYLGFLPKKNYIIFPSERIKKNLQDSFKRIKNIEVYKKFPNHITISIEERKSLLLWCDEYEKCFIVDENGLAYSSVRLDSKEVLENNLVKIISQEKDKGISEGEKILDSKKILFFLQSKDVFYNDSKVEITGDIYIGSRMAEEVIVKSKEGWDIYLSTNFALKKSADMLKILFQKELINFEDRRNLEYIDLRIENRTYYKFKQEVVENIDSQEKIILENDN